jgi:hypothetical protein
MQKREPKKSADDPSKWTELIELVTKIPTLLRLDFKVYEPIPAALAETLAKHHPKAQLTMENWTKRPHGQNHNDIDQIALSKSRNLVSTHADIWATDRIVDLRIPAFVRIIPLALNLKT